VQSRHSGAGLNAAEVLAMTTPHPSPPPSAAPARLRERPLASDPFMVLTYLLVGAAAITQAFLLVWLDLP
jgi:hypothetical protein